MICKNVQALTAYTPGEQPKDAGIIKLNTNENPYPPSPKVAEALRTFDAARLRLYPDPVFMALRLRIAEIHGCTAEQVFIGNGSDEILALCTRAFVENDGSVGYFVPSYSLYPVLADIRRDAASSGAGIRFHMARAGGRRRLALLYHQPQRADQPVARQGVGRRFLPHLPRRGADRRGVRRLR